MQTHYPDVAMREQLIIWTSLPEPKIQVVNEDLYFMESARARFSMIPESRIRSTGNERASEANMHFFF